MKDMLSKEHYCYEQYTPLMKSSAYIPPPPPPPHTHTHTHFYRQPFLYGSSPFLQFDKRILSPPAMIYDFSKVSTPL